MMRRPGPAATRRIAASSALAATLLSGLSIWPVGQPVTPVTAQERPLVLRQLRPAGDQTRRLFRASPPSVEDSLPADAPALMGIAGRLPADAVAMIRDESGRSRILAIGQSHEGWRLEALAADAALFTRGGRRLRIELAPIQDNQ